jgi:hypothetical protein
MTEKDLISETLGLKKLKTMDNAKNNSHVYDLREAFSVRFTRLFSLRATNASNYCIRTNCIMNTYGGVLVRVQLKFQTGGRSSEICWPIRK